MSRLLKRIPAVAVQSTPEEFDGSAEIVPLLKDDDLLKWEVDPHNGTPSFDVDLTEFARGNLENGISQRPDLIRELAPAIRSKLTGAPRHSTITHLVALRHFWRFLDHLSICGQPVTTVSDVSHAHGQLFKTWLLQDRISGTAAARNYVGFIRTVVSHARRQSCVEHPDLLWPTVVRDRGTSHKDVDPIIFKPLYTVLKAHHAASGHAIREGAEMRLSGMDPRNIGDGTDKEAWSVKANVAIVAREFVLRSFEDLAITQMDVATRFGNPTNYDIAVSCPNFIPEHKRGAFDSVRWFVPTFEDTACAYLLTLLHLGWNPDTVCNIDVSSDEAWCDFRLGTKEDRGATVAIYGYKSKVGKEQIAFSLVRPRAHPYQVIRSIIERTAPLRDALRNRLATLERHSAPTKHQRREMEALRQKIRSPWLYYKRKSHGGGRVGCIVVGQELTKMLQSFGLKAIKAALALHHDQPRQNLRRYFALKRLTPSDLRDGFAAFVYDSSLYNVLLLKKALGHTSLHATRSYLRQRRQIAHRFREFTRFQEAFFDEIRHSCHVDPTILYLRLRFGDVTEELRGRLADHRVRTRMGMGCLDPENPPQEIAPGHQGGPCLVQRCTICIHGVVFKDSLSGLAIRMAELRFIRGHVAAERFANSSFEFEWIAIERTVSTLYPERISEFEAAIDQHLLLLKAGKVFLFDQVPSLFFTVDNQ
jgi:hypothetical protein